MSTGFGHLSLPDTESDVEEFDDFEDEDFDLEADSADQDGEGTESHDESGEDWEARFKGLQSEHQKTVEGIRQLQGMMAQQQQHNAAVVQGFQQQLFQQQIADLEPEEQAAAWANFQQTLRNQQIVQSLNAREQQLAQLFQFVNEAGRKVAAKEMAMRYQVPAETLMKFDSPEEMIEAAKMAKSKRSRRTSSNPSASKGTRTRFESGTNPGKPRTKEKPKTIAEAKAAFAALPTPGGR